jgi:steroid delta-isomerase-like uncharacterized protein
MSRDANKAICRRFINRLYNEEGSLSSIRAFVSPNSVHHELDGMNPPSGRGSDWFADMVRLYRVGFPDLRVEIQDQIAETDRVVTCLRLQGTQSGPLLGIGASGRTVDVTGIRVDRLTQGKIAESWFHWDSLGMLEQIGALPALDRNPKPAPWAQAGMPRSSEARLKPAA